MTTLHFWPSDSTAVVIVYYCCDCVLLLSQVNVLEKLRVVCVACGSRNAQTLAATENGQLWSWGDGAFGKLGKGDLLKCSMVPITVRNFTKEGGIAQLECGTHFSVLLTKEGKVYTW